MKSLFLRIAGKANGAFEPTVQPIRIAPDAFGPGLPSRDLWVSPEHAVFFRNHLVPAKHLVNGSAVVRDESVEAIAYYHVLLDRHAVVFSEGLPTESYCPQENLDYFENVADCPAEWRSDLVAPIGLSTPAPRPGRWWRRRGLIWRGGRLGRLARYARRVDALKRFQDECMTARKADSVLKAESAYASAINPK